MQYHLKEYIIYIYIYLYSNFCVCVSVSETNGKIIVSDSLLDLLLIDIHSKLKPHTTHILFLLLKPIDKVYLTKYTLNEKGILIPNSSNSYYPLRLLHPTQFGEE